MRIQSGGFAWLAAVVLAGAAPGVASAACPPLLEHSFTTLQDGKPMPLCQYAGKVILVVNTASYCGFTGQYDGLEKLYARLEVLLQRQDRLRPVFAKEFAQQRQLLFAAAEHESDSDTSAAESVPVPSRSAVRVGKPRPFVEVVPGDQLELQFAVSA